MELRILKYFLVVAKEESISNAANVLHLSQPSLSRQIMELEKELGKQLFIRNNRGITLTEEGKLLLRRATEILTLVTKTEIEIKENGDTVTGDLYIGGGETKAMSLIAQAAKQLSTLHPYVRYHLYSGNSDDVVEQLEKGILDFGVLVEPFSSKKYDSLRLPICNHWGVLIPQDSPLSKLEVVTPEDLWHFPLILSRQSISMESQLRWLKKSSDELNIIGTYNLINNASLMVEAGVGYAICLDKLMHSNPNGSLCFKPLLPEQKISMDIVWKKSHPLTKVQSKFLEQLEVVINSHISHNDSNEQNHRCH